MVTAFIPSDYQNNAAIAARHWTGRANCAKVRGLSGVPMPGPTTKLDGDVLAKARAAGLDKAVAEFPDCVADAARAAALDLADVPPIDGSSEPWPPMSVRSPR
jgi:hypothetical protein